MEGFRGGSFVYHLQTIFARFQGTIKLKGFRERRIHRFINQHSNLLLPSHKSCFFEYELILNDEKRKADFILEQEPGMPPLLIELEPPSDMLFRQDGEFTARALHARHQISEWIRFIDQNPENTAGSMAFLRIPTKQRMIIMGRGMDQRTRMLNSNYTDTIMWTYDMLISNAKDQANRFIKSQCQALGITDINLVR